MAINNKNILYITDMHITPSNSESIELEQERITKDIYDNNSGVNKGDIVISKIVTEIDYTIKGILTNGNNFEICFHDPKGLIVKEIEVGNDTANVSLIKEE